MTIQPKSHTHAMVIDQSTARDIPNGVVNINVMLEASKGLTRGMGAVPMADATPTPQQKTQPTRPLVVYLRWLGFIVAVFGVALWALWSVSQ